MRQIVVDTETTGLDFSQGHRVIEIGCVELIDRRMSGATFHRYIDPQREIDEAAFEIHGITPQMLEGKPVFSGLADELFDFLKDAELIIHNAPFDLAFLNGEFELHGRGGGLLEEHCSILDTLVMARHKHPGQRNSLDALCKRYSVDNTKRALHGALLDAEILADVYLAMTGGQVTLLGGETETPDYAQDAVALPDDAKRVSVSTPLICAREEELAQHEKWMQLLKESSEDGALWKRMDMDMKNDMNMKSAG